MAHASHDSYSSSHTNHTVHSSTIDPNTGSAITLTWTNWPSGSITETYIYQANAKIKELRDKISYLQINKGPWVKDSSGVYVADNPDQSTNLAKDADATFNSDASIVDDQYDGLRDSIEALNLWMTSTTKNSGDGASTGLPTKNAGDTIYKTHFEDIKTKIDALAANNLSAKYSAHHIHSSHSSTPHTNHQSHSSGPA
jgi:hypothetical protein